MNDELIIINNKTEGIKAVCGRCGIEMRTIRSISYHKCKGVENAKEEAYYQELSNK